MAYTLLVTEITVKSGLMPSVLSGALIGVLQWGCSWQPALASKSYYLSHTKILVVHTRAVMIFLWNMQGICVLRFLLRMRPATNRLSL